MRKTILAAAFLAGLSGAFGPSVALAQVCPAVAALPDSERRVAYSPSSSTGPFAVTFAILGDGTDAGAWLEVWLNGSRLTYTTDWTFSLTSGTVATACRPITNGQVTLTVASTGTLQIVGARRPRRTSQFAENRGVAARDLNQAITDIIAQNRETWDKINDVSGRGLFSQPGVTLGPLPLPASCAGGFLGFDATGLIPQCLAGGAGSGNVVGPATSTVGNIPLFNNATGTLLSNSGVSIGQSGAKLGRLDTANTFSASQQVSLNQNAETFLAVINTSAGTSALADLTVNNGTGTGAIGIGGTGHTLTALYQNRVLVGASAATAGIVINNVGANPTIFGTSNAEVGRITSTGQMQMAGGVIGANPTGQFVALGQSGTPPQWPDAGALHFTGISPNNQNSFVTLWSFGNNGFHNATSHFNCMATGQTGTLAVPTAAGTVTYGQYGGTTGDYLCWYGGGGYDGTLWASQTGGIAFRPTQLWTNAAHGTMAAIAITPNGSTITKFGFTFDQNNSLLVNANAQYPAQGFITNTLLHITPADAARAIALIDSYGNNPSSIVLRGMAGTGASITASTTGSFAGGLYFTGATAANTVVNPTAGGTPSALVTGKFTENWSATTHGIALEFWATANGNNNVSKTGGMQVGWYVGSAAVDPGVDGVLNVTTGFRVANAAAANAILAGNATNFVPTTVGTGVLTALGVNVGTAGAFVVNGGVLGTPSSGTVTNLTGTASININGTVGATTATTGAFTSITANSNGALPLTVSGSAAGVQFNRRDAGAGNWIAYSNAGNFQFFSSVLAADAATINTSGDFIAVRWMQTGAVAVGSLPTCNAGAKAARLFVTDANATFTAGIGAIVAAGGANNVPVTCDGTNWRIG